MLPLYRFLAYLDDLSRGILVLVSKPRSGQFPAAHNGGTGTTRHSIRELMAQAGCLLAPGAKTATTQFGRRAYGHYRGLRDERRRDLFVSWRCYSQSTAAGQGLF